MFRSIIFNSVRPFLAMRSNCSFNLSLLSFLFVKVAIPCWQAYLSGFRASSKRWCPLIWLNVSGWWAQRIVTSPCGVEGQCCPTCPPSALPGSARMSMRSMAPRLSSGNAFDTLPSHSLSGGAGVSQVSRKCSDCPQEPVQYINILKKDVQVPNSMVHPISCWFVRACVRACFVLSVFLRNHFVTLWIVWMTSLKWYSRVLLQEAIQNGQWTPPMI